VGGIEKVEVDVRLITASNIDLESAIEYGKFREDLYYRLNVIPIFIPPLRERPEDIGPLVDHFIAKYASKNNRRIKGLQQAVMDILMNYEWPGNVRELENAIENAVVMTESNMISLSDFPTYLQSHQHPRRRSGVALRDILSKNSGMDYKQQIEICEREIIRKALEAENGNKTHAAKRLGFSIRTLRNKIQKLNL
jgi:transcriptional regulator with PAS, ATPase and Fis domain